MAIFTHGGAVAQILVQVTGDAGSVDDGDIVELSLTVPGSKPDMAFNVSAPALETGLAIVNAICSTAGTVVIRIANMSGGTVNPASQTFRVLGF